MRANKKRSQKTDTNNEATMIKSNNFTESNREKPNIAILTLEGKKDNLIVKKIFSILGVPILF